MFEALFPTRGMCKTELHYVLTPNHYFQRRRPQLPWPVVSHQLDPQRGSRCRCRIREVSLAEIKGKIQDKIKINCGK